MLTPTAHATGIEEPIRWLGPGSTLVLDPPEFFFELETKRIAADLHPAFKAVVPPGGPMQRSYGKQTDAADLADFDEALRTGALHPTDPAAAREQHRLTMQALGRSESTQESSATESPSEESALPSAPAATSAPTPPTPKASPAPVTNEFPSEFADYHHGALSYQTGDKASAAAAWQTLLDRPATERKFRTTWAEYMRGKMALDGAPEEARAHFKKLREAVQAGFVDSLGLAAASIGWEALLELNAKHFREAAQLYLQQLASGDPTAVDSLHVLMDQLLEAQPDLAQWFDDPLLQRLATASALSGIGSFYTYAGDTGGNDGPTYKWLQILEAADARQVKDADAVAWLQYQKGDYKAAVRWLKMADPESAYALWLKAKLALRDGKVDVAARLLAQAVPKLPAAVELESRELQYETLPGQESKGDLGVLRVSQADFLAALRLFLQVSYSDDAEYLAEAVLSLPELKQFIETEPALQAKKEETEETSENVRENFREIVGRRLVRAGKLTEARPWFRVTKQATLDRYMDLLGKGNDTHAAKEARAQALWEAAVLIKDEGSSLFDYGLPAAMAARLSGRAVELGSYPESTITYGKPEKTLPPVSAKERTRLHETSQPALRRYYANYVAADLGWRAAALLPDNQDHTAELLNTAGSWLKNRDSKAADRFYQAIERRCAKTDLGREAIKRHWFVEIPETTPEEQ